MKTLIIEDDLSIQSLIKEFLRDFGVCTFADREDEALQLFKEANIKKDPFNLITLDIMLPGGNGHSILKKIRKYEETMGIWGLDGVKVIMISALGDRENVMGAFRDQCEGYLVKPIQQADLMKQLRELNLIDS